MHHHTAMQSYDTETECPICSGNLIDAGDEFVCQRCGVVQEKEVVDLGSQRTPVAIDFTGQALGGYMGSADISSSDRFLRGFSHSPSKYDYLKLVSDYAGREESAVYVSAKMVERVSEKLGLPKVVMTHSIRIVKKLLSSDVHRRGTNLATISAYSLIAACKIEGVTSANVKDIVGTFQALGRRVKASSLIQLSLESPMKTAARSPEEYVRRVVARLSSNARLSDQLQREGALPTVYFSALSATAGEILNSLGWNSKAGRSPCALAATAVYGAELFLANQEHRAKRITQKDVAACGDTAEYTVREQYRDIFMQTPLRLQAKPGLLLPPPRIR